MTRSRSIPGLPFQLVALYVEHRLQWGAAVVALMVAGGWWLRPAADGGAVANEGLQAAVLQDGFALIQGSGAGQRVVELGPQGAVRRETMVNKPGEPRVVGTRAGAVVAWEDNQKIHLAPVDDDQDVSRWGRTVRMMCDGVASNAARFGVAWLEGDDSVWVVHGPLDASAEDSDDAEDADDADDAEDGLLIVNAAGAARNEWCGVASAENNIALMWRAGDRVSITMCTKKACSSLPASFKLDRALPIVGAGCLRNACLMATRNDAGARLTLVTTRGRTKWSLPLEGAAGAVSIVGVGDRAFAVGFAARGEAQVLKVDRDGKATAVWRDAATAKPPALAWAAGRLAIAHYHGDRAVGETVALAP